MRRRLLISGSVIVLLAIAAFVAGQFISRPVTDGNSMFGSLSIGLKRAADLPAQAPTTIGIVVRREDNTLFIGTNIVKFDTVRDASGKITDRRVAYEGPVLEVVVTHDTVLYRDVTEIDRHSAARQIQQVVRPGRLDDISANAALQAWGERQGDRLIARAIVYSYLQF